MARKRWICGKKHAGKLLLRPVPLNWVTGDPILLGEILLMKTILTLCIVWLTLLGSSSSAAIVNGGFEDAPAFNGWQRVGLTSIQTSGFGINPTQPTQQALIRTGNNPPANTGVSLADMATFLTVTQAELIAIAPGANQNGSAIKQTISVSAGDELTFDWNFVTSEGAGNPQDPAFFSVKHTNSGATDVFFLADPSDADPSNGGTVFVNPEFARQTTYNGSGPYQFALDGDYVLGFGVLNLDDRFGSSGLLIDNVVLKAVPEPTALAGLGLLGLSLTMRRRRRTK